ncbi:aspartyl/glutamyl-tRNA amidotransferase subunit A [Candidatus Uhrbacteria bacterium RIFCSPLOWO2_02_FULL_51_9]|uniref:Glutamyl-tRNA(Gln) amidotransferase subunit A n=1 Tax=Candidatus Uhrbacteria bacterium RIFCSPLOWO2_02_FULL_51_9 TaxID=1802410 RepID=A0A1F7VFM6_9BACT|nr:MAG: aspartyl/glutamyl-tRNA amidotransferase subunit A [Candidatus Uhrbacteria bacterium RIFCSPLOWO2_02_FULL_51_9]
MNYTISQARQALDNREISSQELTREYLSRAKEKNPVLNAFITICEDEAMRMAEDADIRIQRGEQGPLTGIPFGVKDAICTADIRSTASAKVLDTYVPPFDATVIRKIRAQGGVIIGKQNCDAFGHGASNENSMYGVVKNPWDTERVPGGSSGGSAASVAADMCVYSIAEDTGGSIRQPAAFNNIVGLRPSYGRNSRYGVMPMASSLDTVGPITKTVEDCALVMEAIAGRDPLDATTVPGAVPAYTEGLRESIRGLRVGIPREYIQDLPNNLQKIIDDAAEQFRQMGCEVMDVSLPHTKYAVPVYYIIVPSEDSSNLSRMDGIRYGVRAKEKDLQNVYMQSRANGFPAEVKRRIMVGTFALSHGYYDAYYKKAQQVRTCIMRDFEEAFNRVDVLLAPTTPTPPFKIGEKANDPLAMYKADIFVGPAAVAGVPAVSVPGGFVNNLPFGVQFIGPRMSENILLRAAYHFEQATGYGKRAPI